MRVSIVLFKMFQLVNNLPGLLYVKTEGTSIMLVELPVKVMNLAALY